MIRKKATGKRAAAALCSAVAVFAFSVFVPASAGVKASAEETAFCDDGAYLSASDLVSATYTINYDYKVIHEEYLGGNIPGYSITNGEMPNACAPIAATSIIGYNDRYYPNLVPNAEPGMINGSDYMYFPAVYFKAIQGVAESLYNYMKTNVGQDGTTDANFKSGLKEFVNDRGYNLSYSSFYSSKTTVNLTALQQMVNNHKVGALLCSKYNFISAIMHDDSGKSTTVYQVNSSVAHIMMVSGYITIDYYKNNTKFLSETYLRVASGYATGERGYCRLNNNLQIDDALTVNIS